MHMIVMGASGCGKSSVGRGIASALCLPFQEGDDLHPVHNVEKMSRGIPLDDEDRWGWLSRIAELMNATDGALVVSCSALKRRYRDHLRQRSVRDIAFVYLEAEQSFIGNRLAARTDHFMPVSLLSSQFAALEPPMPDERHVKVGIETSLREVIETVVAKLATVCR